MPTVRIRHPDGTEEEHELGDELTVGRAEGNDLILPEGGVSRRHARLFVEGGQVMIEDAGSANGTFVDGERIDGPTPLGPRAQVVIGDYELSAKGGATTARSRPSAREAPALRPRVGGERATTARPAMKAARATKMVPAMPREKPAPRGQRPAGVEPGAGAGPALRGLTGPWLNKVYPIRGKVTVGRVPGVEVQIEDDSVSRRHAELEPTARGVVLRDLGSANGTTVNGEPVEGEAVLRAGDVIQFGVIELELEAPEPAALRAPVRRGGGDEESQVSEAAAPGRRKPLLIAAVALVALVGVGAVLKLVLGGGEEVQNGGAQPVAQLDPQAQLTVHLSECRSFASTDTGTPDWTRAEAACNKALDIDPIHGEANQLIRRIRVEKECAEHFSRAEVAMSRLREEEALAAYGKITPECGYAYVKAKPKVKEAIEQVMKKTADDCKRYVQSSQWDSALPRCELHMSFACQNMSSEELFPPPGFELVTHSGRLKRREWRPKDKNYLNFLRARQQADPTAPPWSCPEMKIMRREEGPPDPKVEVKRTFAERFKEKDMALAMEYYFDGRAGEAIVLLQRLRERQEKAPFHAQADEMRRDITNVDMLFKEGQAHLKAEDPERAARPFEEALAIDAKLMQDQADKTLSHFRRNIFQDIASAAYQSGKAWADRKDYRRACKLWKLGFKFYRGNVDLLRATGNVCTAMAQQQLEGASSCEALEKVFDFAVDGDQLKERAEAKKAEWQCP